jgi:hypothetical protein
MYTDLSVDNTVDRQWEWLLCNEPFFYWQECVFFSLSVTVSPINFSSVSSGAPSDVPSIVSRTVSGDYYQRQCPLYFPEVNGYTYGSAKGKTAAQVNAWTKGWDLTDTTRLTWTNGYDQDLFLFVQDSHWI